MNDFQQNKFQIYNHHQNFNNDLALSCSWVKVWNAEFLFILFQKSAGSKATSGKRTKASQGRLGSQETDSVVHKDFNSKNGSGPCTVETTLEMF